MHTNHNNQQLAIGPETVVGIAVAGTAVEYGSLEHGLLEQQWELLL